MHQRLPPGIVPKYEREAIKKERRKRKLAERAFRKLRRRADKREQQLTKETV
jgi:hypothetical protein